MEEPSEPLSRQFGKLSPRVRGFFQTKIRVQWSCATGPFAMSIYDDHTPLIDERDEVHSDHFWCAVHRRRRCAVSLTRNPCLGAPAVATWRLGDLLYGTLILRTDPCGRGRVRASHFTWRSPAGNPRPSLWPLPGAFSVSECSAAFGQITPNLFVSSLVLVAGLLLSTIYWHRCRHRGASM